MSLLNIGHEDEGKKKGFSHWSRMNVAMKNVDKKNKRKYCLNSIFHIKMKQRKKEFPYFVRVNVTIKHFEKKSKRKYCLNSILQMKINERKKRILSLVGNKCNDEKCR